ncbi:MAG TPA: hypothetical protein VFH99_01425 [Candidatus Saccharimonadales bacterium]|nr:hypothetical protein [Candidatus Saccharimonadales bacterium]
MKIESAPAENDHSVFLVDFELSDTTGLHEAHVAFNAIAAHNHSHFEEKSFEEWTGADNEMLAETMGKFLDHGMDKFLSTAQRLSREKTREGFLGDPIHLKATDANLDYLHQALVAYKLGTAVGVLTEMKNAMGNQAGMIRTLEAVVADPMIQRIEGAIEVTYDAEPVRQPLGFGRVLLDSHQTREG